MEEDIAKKPNDTVEESSLKTTAPSLKIAMDVKWGPYFQSGNTIVGLIVMVYLTNQWSNYLQTLHENDMWFSNIKEVEREISFRTEQGFYYSYFKHLIKAPSLSQGISELEKENTTEHPNTINAWKRFNIYQELFLASLHRLYSFNMEPILFYVEVVFSLQGFHAAMLFLISWKLSGTWVSGVLTIFLLFPHRSEITRVSYTVPLREHFSLPFFYAMVVSVARLLEISHSPSNKRKTNSSTLWNSSEFSLVQIFVMTFVFTITWQFAQFALLLHSFALYVLSSAQLLNKDTVCRIFGVQFLAILLVWYLQFYQPMVIISLTVSFLPLAVMSLQSQVHNAGLVRSQTIFKNIVALVVRATLVIIAMVALNMTIKSVMNQTADNHIFQFVASWMGFQDETDFDTRLYRCLSVFRPLSYASYKALASNLALPLYFAYIVLQLVIMWLTIIKKWYFKEKAEDCVELKDEQPSMSLFEKPVIKRRRETPSHKSNKKKAMEPRSAEVEAETGNELWSLESEPATIYISGISAVFALLGMLMLRMIVFWSPFILIFASASICDKKLWTALLNKISPSTDNKIIVSMLRHLVLLFALVVIYLSHKEAILAHLEELREFWDPDTVDLMEWISQKTPKTAAFSGTMQLMAGVKLCTLRPITNHPHFEDKDLRLRTRELYKMYGQMGPEEVYEALVKYNASYIILEDSQCLGAGRSPDRCAMPDTVDLTYGHIPADGKRDPPHLIQSKYPRFCDEIRYGSPSYTKFFRLAFHNKTFRVYQVKPWKGNFSN